MHLISGIANKAPPTASVKIDLVFLLLANFVYILVWHISPYQSGLSFWSDKTSEILHGYLPSSNFYPPGSALLLAPFRLLKLSNVFSSAFFFNIGLMFYIFICRRIDAIETRVCAYLLLSTNFYFMWLLKNSHDVVLEWATLTSAAYFAVASRPLLFAGTASICSLVRATDVVSCLAISLSMLIVNRKKRWLLHPLFVAALSLFNYTTYGSFAPALNGGYNVYIGNDPFYAIGHPRFDIDGFFEAENNPVLAIERRHNAGPLSEKELDAALRSEGVANLLSNPARTAYHIMMKTHLWLFNFEKVPNLGGRAFLTSDRKTIKIASIQSNALYLGNTSYILYKIIYNLLFAAALMALFFTPRAVFSNRVLLVALPLISTLPVAVLTFPDTRFKIVYEVVMIPAMLWIVRHHRSERFAGRATAASG